MRRHNEKDHSRSEKRQVAVFYLHASAYCEEYLCLLFTDGTTVRKSNTCICWLSRVVVTPSPLFSAKVLLQSGTYHHLSRHNTVLWLQSSHSRSLYILLYMHRIQHQHRIPPVQTCILTPATNAAFVALQAL